VVPFNLNGMPAITLPCGKDVQGAPLSGQLAGHPGKNPVLLSLAHEIKSQFENAL
jgi:Asp-tRNA(Asn)/Glu-tRNA(Gln) amidotransferase A subunit family amidase